MKKLIKFLVVFMVCCVGVMTPARSYTERSVAVLRVLNKAAGKTQTVHVPVGRKVDFEKLSIVARSCKQSDPFDAENFFAFVEISDSDQGQIFGNWMNRNEPGKNPLQNPDYDVWLLSCE